MFAIAHYQKWKSRQKGTVNPLCYLTDPLKPTFTWVFLLLPLLNPLHSRYLLVQADTGQILTRLIIISSVRSWLFIDSYKIHNIEILLSSRHISVTLLKHNRHEFKNI